MQFIHRSALRKGYLPGCVVLSYDILAVASFRDTFETRNASKQWAWHVCSGVNY